MKTFFKIAICLLGISMMGLNTQGGRAVLGTAPIDEQPGEQRWFVTPTGTGDCTSWASACTFRSVLSKLSATKDDVIYLGAGNHDMNNGSDATGTTISDNYFHIVGVGNSIGGAARLINSANPATHVLRVTGTSGIIENVVFGNTGQPDANVILLNIRASFNTVEKCTFTQGADGGGTGVLIDNNSNRVNIVTSNFYSIVDYAIELNDANKIIIRDNNIFKGGKGLYVTNALDTDVYVQDTHFKQTITAVEISNSSTTGIHFDKVCFQDNTTDVVDNGIYGGSHWSNINSSSSVATIYPAGAGAEISKTEDPWVWGDAVEVIPVSTVTKPFKIVSINIQDWSDAQTFKIQLLRGEVTATIPLGTYEVTLGDPAAKKSVSITPPLREIFVPADSVVGAKIMTSTDGSDDITITLSYESL